jgi:hypothetical protein
MRGCAASPNAAMIFRGFRQFGMEPRGNPADE